MRRLFLKDFNLIVSCPRERERGALSEIRYFIGDLLEDQDLRIMMTHVSGLIVCKTSLDPFDVVEKLREFAIENPYQFRFAIKFTPIIQSVRSSIDEIAKVALEIAKRIDDKETFRVTVRRRHTDLDHMDIISAVAKDIDNEVNLDNPDKTILIEVIGESTGVTLLDSDDDILSIMSMRDDMY